MPNRLNRVVLALLISLTTLSATAAVSSLQRYDYVDPSNIVPDTPLKQALTYFDAHKSSFPNQNYIVVVDFAQRNTTRRMYVINMSTGAVQTHAVAVGKNSDADGNGYANRFSNSPGSDMSSLGIYRTAEIYYGEHGRSLRLDGLSPTNSNVRSRAIVIHRAPYVSDSSPYAGRSWGCFALDPSITDTVISELAHGAMLYAWYN